MIAAHPLLGVGLNNFCGNMYLYDKYAVTAVFPAPVHNLFLLTASETGLISLLLILLYVVGIMKESVFIYLRDKDELFKNFALGLFCGISGIFVHNMVSGWLRFFNLYQLFFILCTMLLAIKYNLKIEEDDSILEKSVV